MSGRHMECDCYLGLGAVALVTRPIQIFQLSTSDQPERLGVWFSLFELNATDLQLSILKMDADAPWAMQGSHLLPMSKKCPEKNKNFHKGDGRFCFSCRFRILFSSPSPGDFGAMLIRSLVIQDET